MCRNLSLYYDDEGPKGKIVLDLSNNDISSTSEINGHINNSNNLIYDTLNLSSNFLTNIDFSLNKVINIKYCTHVILTDNSLDNLIIKNLPRTITKITCRSNNIKNVENIVSNGKIKTVREIDLSDNPICNTTNYRLQLLNIMPSLREINGVKVTKEERRMNKKQKNSKQNKK